MNKLNILIRFDDICPTMDYSQFKKATDLLDKYNVHPLIGVIPECQDEELLIEEYHSDFWNYIKELEKKGYKIAMHGFNHVYDTKTRGNINCGFKSEFAGHSFIKQYEKIKNELKEKYSIEIDNIEDVSIVPYIYNMEEIMNIVDLVVSRSGAMTITEIANVGVPAIFIPFPFATENHQEYNAKVLENVGAAKIILDKNLTSNELNSTITNLVENKNALKDMGKKANQVAIQNVEEKIYKEIKEL